MNNQPHFIKIPLARDNLLCQNFKKRKEGKIANVQTFSKKKLIPLIVSALFCLLKSTESKSLFRARISLARRRLQPMTKYAQGSALNKDNK
jgi:hypothetical protein